MEIDGNCQLQPLHVILLLGLNFNGSKTTARLLPYLPSMGRQSFRTHLEHPNSLLLIVFYIIVYMVKPNSDLFSEVLTSETECAQ